MLLMKSLSGFTAVKVGGTLARMIGSFKLKTEDVPKREVSVLPFRQTGKKRYGLALMVLLVILLEVSDGRHHASCYQSITTTTHYLVDESLSQVEMRVGKCLKLVLEGKGMLRIVPTAIDLTPALRRTRRYMVAPRVGKVVDRDRCPSKPEANCSEVDTAMYPKVYQTCYPDRGWADGCGLYAKGSACTRVDFVDDLGTRLECNAVEGDEIELYLNLTFGPAVKQAKLNKWQEKVSIGMGNSQSIEIQCGLEEFSRISMMEYCFQRGQQAGVFLPASVYSEIDWPYTLPEQDSVWRQKDSLIEWIGCEKHGVPYRVMTDGTAKLYQMMQKKEIDVFWKNGRHHLADGRINCNIWTRGLKTTRYEVPECSGSDLKEKKAGKTVVSANSLIVPTVVIGAEEYPCKVPVKAGRCIPDTEEVIYLSCLK